MDRVKIEEDAFFLGIGEAAMVRWPTDEEQSWLRMDHLEPVLVISHVDREDYVLPVIEAFRVTARGVR